MILNNYTLDLKTTNLKVIDDIGVGIDNPQAPIHSHVASASAHFIKITNSTTGSGSLDGFDIGIGSTGQAFIVNRENSDIRFLTNNADKVIILDTGEVGIGLLDPKLHLHIHRSSAEFAATKYTNSTSGSTTADGFDVGLAGTGDAILINRENTAMTFYTNSNLRLTITNSGDIEIPTSANLQGGVPVGTIVAWLPGHFSAIGNVGYAGVAITLPSWWRLCDGTVIGDAESPLNNGGAGRLPDLDDFRFLMGAGVGSRGNAGGSNSSAHTHTTDVKLSSIAFPHTHTVNSHSHSAGSLHAQIQPFNDRIIAKISIHTSWTSTYTGTGLTSIAPGTNTGSATDVAGSTSSESPGTNSQLSSSMASHDHTTISQSVTENRPQYLAVTFIMRIK